MASDCHRNRQSGLRKDCVSHGLWYVMRHAACHHDGYYFEPWGEQCTDLCHCPHSNEKNNAPCLPTGFHSSGSFRCSENPGRHLLTMCSIQNQCTVHIRHQWVLEVNKCRFGFSAKMVSDQAWHRNSYVRLGQIIPFGILEKQFRSPKES